MLQIPATFQIPVLANISFPQVWQPLGAHQRFADVVAVLREAMAFFETAVHGAKLRDPSIGAVMQVAVRGHGFSS